MPSSGLGVAARGSRARRRPPARRRDGRCRAARPAGWCRRWRRPRRRRRPPRRAARRSTCGGRRAARGPARDRLEPVGRRAVDVRAPAPGRRRARVATGSAGAGRRLGVERAPRGRVQKSSSWAGSGSSWSAVRTTRVGLDLAVVAVIAPPPRGRGAARRGRGAGGRRRCRGRRPGSWRPRGGRSPRRRRARRVTRWSTGRSARAPRTVSDGADDALGARPAGHRVDGSSVDSGRALALAQLVDARVVGDAVEPGAEVAARPEPGQGPVGLEVRLLEGVVHAVAVGHEPVGQRRACGRRGGAAARRRPTGPPSGRARRARRRGAWWRRRAWRSGRARRRAGGAAGGRERSRRS